MLEKGADGIFNVCSGRPVPVRQVVATIADLIGRPDLVQFGALPCRAWEPPMICGDNARLRSLGWQPCYSLEEGLSNAIREHSCAVLAPGGAPCVRAAQIGASSTSYAPAGTAGG
jgi:nucleoside-diphosphate-sugar epimerase